MSPRSKRASELIRDWDGRQVRLVVDRDRGRVWAYYGENLDTGFLTLEAARKWYTT